MHAQRRRQIVADGDDEGGALPDAEERRRNGQRPSLLAERLDAERRAGVAFRPPAAVRGAQPHGCHVAVDGAGGDGVVVGADALDRGGGQGGEAAGREQGAGGGQVEQVVQDSHSLPTLRAAGRAILRSG
jgi:hypothetical protein